MEVSSGNQNENEIQGKKRLNSLKQVENQSNYDQNSISSYQSNGLSRTAQKPEIIESKLKFVCCICSSYYKFVQQIEGDFQVQIRSTVANINNDLKDITLRVSQLESKLKIQVNILNISIIY